MRRIVLMTIVCAAAMTALATSAEALHTCSYDADGKYTCPDAPNRQPVADAGPDQVVSESSIIVLDGSASFDPDGDDLEYRWRLASISDSSVLPLQDCGFECDPEDEQLMFYAPYLPPGQKARVTMAWELAVYDRDPAEVGSQENHLHQDLVTITVMNTNQPPHGWFGGFREIHDANQDGVNDIQEEWGSPSTGDPEEPDYIHLRFGYKSEGQSVWDETSFDIVQPPQNPEYIDAIQFEVEAWDDKQIVTVEVYLYPSDQVDDWEDEAERTFQCEAHVVPHKVRFGLGRQHLNPAVTPMDSGDAPNYRNQAYKGQTEPIGEYGEVWAGQLSVAHPKLTVGDYRVCARAFDAEGGNTTSSPEVDFLTILDSMERNQRNPCLALIEALPGGNVTGAIRPDVPEKPTAEPIDRFECTQPATPPDNTCSVYPPQVLGPGEIVRIDARVIPFGTPDDGARYNPHTGYLMEKVTIQNNLTQGDQTPPVLGPETELRAPHVITLDTLAPGTQRIHVRAYDRAGGTAEICIPITTDTATPETLLSHPDTYYLNVPGAFRVYLHDQVDAQSVLEIKRFIAGTPYRERLETEPLSTILAETPVEGPFPAESLDRPQGNDYRVTRLPALSPFPQVDVNGDGFLDALFDHTVVSRPERIGDPDHQYTWDRYYDYITETVHVLRQIDCDGDRVKDHVEDLNGDGKCDPGEPAIRAQGRRAPDLNAERIVYTDALSLARPAPGEVRSFLQDRPTWVFQFNVTPIAQGVYNYVVMTSDVATNSFVETGNFTVAQYLADVRIVNVTEGPGAPFLPGDTVLLYANITHESPLEDNFARIPIYYSFAKEDPFAGMGDGILNGSINFPALLAAGTITPLQCVDPSDPDGEPETCLMELGKTLPAEGNFSFYPGEHTVFVSARAAPGIDESAPEDNVVEHTFEVYLGQTIVDEELSFYIRAEPSGLPRLVDGVIDLESGETYTMALDVAGENYEWTVGNNTYYWDPDQRRDPADPDEECDFDAGSQTYPAPCRPITLYEAPEGDPGDPESPGAGLLLLVGALALLGVAVRRR